MDNKIKIFSAVIGILILGVGATALLRGAGTPAGPGVYDGLAQCIKDSGAIFYGAFWCPHCQSQKKMFGSSAKLLPYVECSTADGKGQLPVCIDEGVASYPTWDFADGSRLTGEVALKTFAEKTSCALPEDFEVNAPIDPGASSDAAGGTVPEEGDEVPGIAE